MNILFVLYESFTSNSAIHVHYLANQLAESGCACFVACPAEPIQVPGLAQQRYRAYPFARYATMNADARASGGIDIIHAWTPRENVRKFTQRALHDWPVPLIVHLEDNEDAIFERYFPSWTQRIIRTYITGVPGTVSHPINARKMLAAADGLTIISEKLREFAPDGTPTLHFIPGIDHELFRPADCHQAPWRDIPIPADVFKLVYTGNVHRANLEQVRSIYLAAGILARRGIHATVIRTGLDHVSPKSGIPSLAKELTVELGYVDYTKLPLVMACADLLVQPGRTDRYEDYRLPSKLPEYLAMGKPVVMPAANLGRQLRHLVHAFVYPEVGAEEIASAAAHLIADDGLAQRMGRAAAKFAQAHFSWNECARRVLDFYATLQMPPRNSVRW